MYWRAEGGSAIRRCAGSGANLHLYTNGSFTNSTSSVGSSDGEGSLTSSPPMLSRPYSISPPQLMARSYSPPPTSPRGPKRPFERTWSEDVLRVVCISDTHSRHDALLEDGMLPQGDVLVHAGDFSTTGTKAQVEDFRNFLKSVPHPHKVVIAGNHDITLDEGYYNKTGEARFHKGRRDGPFFPGELRRMLAGTDALESGIRYLENDEVTIQGIRFWGSPFTPAYNDWAFVYEPDSEDCQKLWSSIPEDVDVLITHGPPLGLGDLTHRGKRAGCSTLLREIRSRVKPRLNVFGHIHEGYGVYQDDLGIHYINASTSTLQYRPTQPPIVIDIPLDRSRPIEWVTPVEIKPVRHDEDFMNGGCSPTSALSLEVTEGFSYVSCSVSTSCTTSEGGSMEEVEREEEETG